MSRKKAWKSDPVWQRRSRARKQIHQARRVLLAEYRTGQDQIPDVEEVTEALLRLADLPWNRPAQIRELEVLFEFRALKQYTGAFVPDPNADVRGLVAWLKKLTNRMHRKDVELRKKQVSRAIPARETGRPLAYLLGVYHATRDAKIGLRRQLAADARDVSIGTMRRWHERELCELLAAEMVRVEADLIRALPSFVPDGRPLPTA